MSGYRNMTLQKENHSLAVLEHCLIISLEC